MIEKRTIARPYAKAVFEIASQANTYVHWSKVLVILSGVAEHPQVSALLKETRISTEALTHFFIAIGGKALDTLAQHFVLLLASRHRLALLPEIRLLYEEMRSELENTSDLRFFSPTVLSETEKIFCQKALERQLSRRLNIEYDIDKTLLGGFVAIMGNYVIDASVRGYLTNLKMAVMGV